MACLNFLLLRSLVLATASSGRDREGDCLRPGCCCLCHHDAANWGRLVEASNDEGESAPRGRLDGFALHQIATAVGQGESLFERQMRQMASGWIAMRVARKIAGYILD